MRAGSGGEQTCIEGLPNHRPDEVRRLVTTGLALACAAFAIQTLLSLVNVYAADGRIAQLDLEEGGVVTWAASSATIADTYVQLIWPVLYLPLVATVAVLLVHSRRTRLWRRD